MGLAFVGLQYRILSVLLYCVVIFEKNTIDKRVATDHTQERLCAYRFRFIVATGGYTRNGKQRRFAKSSLKTQVFKVYDVLDARSTG